MDDRHLITEDRYLITEDVAGLARTSPATVRYWRHTGKGPHSFKVGRRVLYDAVDVRAWIEQAKAQGAESNDRTPPP